MDRFSDWFYVIIAVMVALGANSIAAIWASKEDKFSSPWFWVLIVVSPLVFITFGLVTSRLGLSLSAGTVDILLSIATILVGLFIFREIGSVTTLQLVGMGLAVLGIVFMHIQK